MHILALIALFFVALVAGILDTLAGGGGLLTVPALLSFNLSPATVLGTNKFQAVFGEFNASVHFFRRQQFHLKEIGFGLLMLVVGATLGAVVVQIIHPRALQKLIPFLLLAILIYTILSPTPMHEARKPKLSQHWFYCTFGLAIGFYNGFFGPGTGSFLVVTIMIFFRIRYCEINNLGKAAEFCCEFCGTALVYFWWQSKLCYWWFYGVRATHWFAYRRASCNSSRP